MPHCANCAKLCARHLHASQTGKKKIQTKKTIMPGVRFQMQADLVDFSLLKSYNDNYKYILVVVDVFSKKDFTAYLKSKSSLDIIKAFECVMPEIGKFSKLQTDMGREYLNRPFQSWLKQRHIDHFHTQNFDTKATIAERSICTLKERLWRYFTYTNSRRYVEALSSIEMTSQRRYVFHSAAKLKVIDSDFLLDNFEFFLNFTFGIVHVGRAEQQDDVFLGVGFRSK